MIVYSAILRYKMKPTQKMVAISAYTQKEIESYAYKRRAPAIGTTTRKGTKTKAKARDHIMECELQWQN